MYIHVWCVNTSYDGCSKIVRNCLRPNTQFISASATLSPGHVELIEDLVVSIDESNQAANDTIRATKSSKNFLSNFRPRNLHKILLCSAFKVHSKSGTALGTKIPELATLKGNVRNLFVVS